MILNFIKKISVFASSLILLFSVKIALAIDYVPLEPGAFQKMVGSGGGTIHITDLKSFVGKIFNFGIAIAAALAVVMIAWGGIQYMTTDSWTGKEDGRKKIEDALYGLGIALVSWLILYTINPELVSFSTNVILNP